MVRGPILPEEGKARVPNVFFTIQSGSYDFLTSQGGQRVLKFRGERINNTEKQAPVFARYTLY